MNKYFFSFQVKPTIAVTGGLYVLTGTLVFNPCNLEDITILKIKR